MIPLYGFLEGDTIGLLIFAYPQDTIEDLIDKVQKSASVRIKPRTDMHFFYKNQLIESHILVKELNVQPLELFFVASKESVYASSINT